MKSFTQRWREASNEAEDQPMTTPPTDPKEAPDDDCGVQQINIPAKVLHTQMMHMKIGPNGIESVETEAERALAAQTAELDAVRKERDGFESTSLMVFGQLKAAREQRDAAQAKCAELEKLIQDAPHTLTCKARDYLGGPINSLCDCWKSRLTPTQQASAWRLIETAPKDGRFILGYFPKTYFPNKENRRTIRWNDFHEMWTTEAIELAGVPTHWQPLPAPPEEKRP